MRIYYYPFAQKSIYREDGTQRYWLSFSKTKSVFFCSICLAFSEFDNPSPFIKGMNDWKHTYARIKVHEKSKHPNENTEAFMMKTNKSNIDVLIFLKQKQLRRK